VALDPLDEAAARRLLADWVGLQPALVAELAARCEGDIGLALDLVTDGLASGRFHADPGGLRAAPGTVLAELPDPVARVERWAAAVHLPSDPSVRAAVLCAAALGPFVADDLWERATGDASACARATDLLRARGLLAPVTGGWRWTSPVPRRRMLAGPEAVVHLERCASVLEGRGQAWRRGQLLLAAGRLDDALSDLFAGAGDAIASGQMARATSLVGELEQVMTARGVPTSSARWGELWLTAGMIGPTHQGHAACWMAYERALHAARRHPTDPAWTGVRSSAVAGSIWLANVQLLPRRAKPLLDEYRELVDAGVGREDTRVDHVGWYALTVGRSALSKAAFTRARELAVARGATRLRFVADASLGVAKRHAGDPDAVEHLERAGAAMLEAGFLSARADLAAALGDAERWRGNFERARQHYDEALRAEAEGEARADPGFRLGLGLLLRAMGDVDAAEEAIRRCRSLLTDHGPAWEGGLLLHHASVGGEVDVHLALARIREAGHVDPDLVMSARVLADRVGDAPSRSELLAFAEDQERCIEAGRIEPVSSL
jgi:tetratricopeptide (TPR) repeat protein